MTDHGISHARGKQFLYNEGTHIPFIVRGPGIPVGMERADLIEHIDMAAISLAAAGIAIPPVMQGKDVFAKDYKPRTHVFAARDRCDETVERLRSVRSDRFLYIKNFHPKRPHLQPNAYKDGKPIIQKIRALHESHALSPLQESLLFAPERPAEELYDWINDPWQVNNLADQPEYSEHLSAHRDTLQQWIRDSHDKGPESDAMYDSDMAVYLGKRKPGADDTPSPVQQNITQMKRWAAEGR
jgi:arylsulfatase A-like enzyme